MVCTIWLGDTHADKGEGFEVLEAIGKLTHVLDARAIHTGDIIDGMEMASFEQEVQGILQKVQQIPENQRETLFQKINQTEQKLLEDTQKKYEHAENIFQNYKHGIDGVLGNHDIKEMVEKFIPSFRNFEYKTIKVNGYNYTGVYHSSANFFAPEEENHKSLEENIDFVKEAAVNTDFIVSHELPHKKLAHKRKNEKESNNFSKDLYEIATENKNSIIGGHVHSPEHLEENGISFIRAPLGKEGQNGAFYIANHDDGWVYKVEKKYLLQWYKQSKESN